MGRENDQTQNMARAAVVVAAVRSGGTFLTHALSSHPYIFCDRGEPLHHKSAWVKSLRPDRIQLLEALTNQTGYRVSAVKLTYTQALHRDIWPWLVAKQPLVIHLTRENLIRQAVSMLINKQSRAGNIKRPQHTFEDTRPVQVELAPALVLKAARTLRAQDRRAAKMLKGRIQAVMPLTYAQVVGGEGESAEWMPTGTARQVCKFLGVYYHRLHCDLRRVNAQPLRALLSNWRQVEAAVRGSELAACLEDERIWDG